VRVKILHRQWLEQYRQRKSRFEETISYDAAGNEIERTICIIEIMEVFSPPKHNPLF